MSVKPDNSENNDLDKKLPDDIRIKDSDISSEDSLLNQKLPDDIKEKPKPEDEEPNMFFNFLQLFGNKVLLLSSLSDSSGYKYYLFMLWSAFAIAIYLIAKNVKSTETAFLLYSCDVWIISLAILIFLYR
jgi:hypothetical protein